MGQLTPQKLKRAERLIRERTEVSRSGCWIWQGYVGPTGYARVRDLGDMHRISYEIHKGPIPEGLHIDHRTPPCTSRACVNPDHLDAVTRGENRRRAWTNDVGQMGQLQLRAAVLLHDQVTERL